ncbi:ABC transporter ATP-binding protein (plasmid) [Bradyrhizobium sp. ISRA443]|uniref:ABC transporter ATP-binding protein n=1 Tax=unclassified Bradyrhizobium TaxID=2631580 RepID=UPI00247AD912|nr:MULTISPECIES: ABC transporter ATP-binding protein [unclassified Bradyrhizobium]WGS03115.1 ABC transporter ATP-binding protein [Bradyrhizobium sp. ISRA436]WGS09852.1 ABC transporter ATP-binding protein [Bradyrhizobium sp. ISRA437]WGS16737.1 ABC transporter ATP-binding protein [Bradyrhizobium sp. ISRA443]
MVEHAVSPNDRGSTFVARKLVKTYQTEAGEVHALRGVDLELTEGEFIVLLGPSGSGKSTFLNILGGLDIPTSGDIFFRGDDLTQFTESKRTEYRRERIGFVFQFYNLIPSLTASENVMLATDIARRPLPAAEALGLVGLTHRMDHFPAELSGGEQQRVAVARAIAKRPDVLLCDEPTGALDSKTGVVVLEALERASRAVGTTTVLITHNAAIGDMADRVVHFADGCIVNIRTNARRKQPSDLSW